MQVEVVDPDIIRKRLEFKEQQIEEAIENKDFDTLFTWVDNRNKLDYFLEYYDEIQPNEVIKYFREAYSLTEYGFERMDPETLMDIYEYGIYKKPELKGEITIYRGYTNKSTRFETNNNKIICIIYS